MPIHLDERDVVPEVEGLSSVLIVACNMCAGASLAMQEGSPFLQLFRSRLKSPPLERYVRRLASTLGGKGVKTRRFRGGLIQQFFLCLWTSQQRRKLHECAKEYDGVIVLGCESAFATVRESVEGANCAVIEGMKVAGVMNTKTRFRFPCDIFFEHSQVVPMCDRHCKRGGQSAREESSPKSD